MPVLCLDTATATPVVALVGDDGAFLRGAVVDGRAQAVLGALDAVLRGDDARGDDARGGEASGDTVPRSAITAVVVGIGPGTFTGLRVGVATARGIAETLGVPLLGISSLLAVSAADAAEHVGERTWATIAGGRGELFAQSFVATADGRVEAAGEVQVAPTDAIDELVGADRRTASMAPTPESLARAAAEALRDGIPATGDAPTGDPLLVVPRYGRAPDADPPRMDVRYDDLVVADLDALLTLEARCFATPWTHEMYASEFARPASDVVLLAARDAGANARLVGAAIATRIGDSWHVMNVLVDPIARGRGIATRLVADLLARTAALGDVGEGWTLEVRDGNDAAIALYERAGFTSVGRRPGYYEDTGDDALVMWKHAGAGERAGASR